MKTKILFLAIAIMLLSSAVIHAGYDKPIRFEQLPSKAQQFIKTHFPNSKIAIAKKEIEFIGCSYDVIFTNGDKLEFGKNGNWTEISCKYTKVPIEIIPPEILKYVKNNYPDEYVIEIDRKNNYYEINLSNRVEVEFSKRFEIIDIDF